MSARNEQKTGDAEIVKMPLNRKAWFLHEIGGQEPADGLHGPGMGLDVAVGKPNLHDLIGLLWIHVYCAPPYVKAHFNNFAGHLEH